MEVPGKMWKCRGKMLKCQGKIEVSGGKCGSVEKNVVEPGKNVKVLWNNVEVPRKNV